MDGHPGTGTPFAPHCDAPRWAPASLVAEEENMPAVAMPAHQKGDFLVDYEEKVFEDVKALPGEKSW